ncbi:MAG: serine--tRNA ligase [Phycisphaeraceae bacterium]|nr:serine--tRNA ligase [Phycisphaeraceae bacterium]
MIDLKELRADPDRFKRGAREKRVDVDIERLLHLDEARLRLLRDLETTRSEQNRLSREIGPRLGAIRGRLRGLTGAERDALEAELRELEQVPLRLKAEIQAFEDGIARIEPEWRGLWLRVPMPADPDVPRGASSEDNVPIRTWHPADFDPGRPFSGSRGFAPRTHLELLEIGGMVDFARAVKIAGTRHYSLRGDGMRLHLGVLRFAMDLICEHHGFMPVSVPVVVREECMVGTGFFPDGREQAYEINEQARGGGADLFLTGTGEVGLMGLHADEILEEAALPLRYATVSTCFRREAGAAGRDTAGLYRIHQFDKVEQVVLCRADEAESRAWHAKMIGIVEDLLQQLELPHRLLQCCTADLGIKNADMIDIECWMPGRGEAGPDGRPLGAWGETHSASRLYDYQCRRLNLRYRDQAKQIRFCHSLNNTVLASPRILIPLLEIHQNEDGSIRVPAALRPYVGGRETVGGG